MDNELKLPAYMRNPRALGLPFSTIYPNQEKMLLTALEGPSKFLFFEAPTGSGKSYTPTALSKHNDVVVLVETLNLLSQYEREYGFDVIRGKASYPCVNDVKVETWLRNGRIPTAADCAFAPMDECGHAHRCPYLVAKAKGLASNRLAVTYKYAFLSHHIRNRPGIITCDEAHNAAEQIVSFATFEIGEYERTNWGFDKFPLVDYGESGKGDLLNSSSREVVRDWIHRCLEVLADIEPKDDIEEAKINDEKRRLNGIGECLDGAFEWFFECRKDLYLYRGKKSSGMRLRPLDPHAIAGQLWSGKSQVILMSATIGNPAPLARALGIEHYHSESYLHPIPAHVRPVLDLGLPRMTWGNIKNDPRIFGKQAGKLASYIDRNFDPAWRGIMLTSSYEKIRNLAEELQKRWDRRLIVQEQGMPLADITDRFLNDRKPGDVLVASIQGFGQGLDLKADLARWAVIAGVPFDNHTDRYEQMRKKINGEYGWWKSYNAVPQGCGRVSRGSKNGNGEYLTNYALLADGSATTERAFKYYPDWFKNVVERA